MLATVELADNTVRLFTIKAQYKHQNVSFGSDPIGFDKGPSYFPSFIKSIILRNQLTGAKSWDLIERIPQAMGLPCKMFAIGMGFDHITAEPRPVRDTRNLSVLATMVTKGAKYAAEAAPTTPKSPKK